MRKRQRFSLFRQIRYYLWVILGAGVLTLMFFIVLPLMQTISKPPTDDLLLAEVDFTELEPPPPPPAEEEPEPEPELEEPPPELAEEAPPLDLSQLELALNPSLGQGLMGSGDYAVKLNTAVNMSSSKDLDEVFSMADLDQKPRPIYQPSPAFSSKLRRRAPATVYIVFVVDENGRVVKPQVQKSDDPLFEKPALAAVKKWKFEPGKRGGEAVRFRMRVPITFPAG